MNRRQRRAAATTTSSTCSTELSSAAEIPLAQPARGTAPSKTGGKPKRTLYEIAAERQAALSPNGANNDSPSETAFTPSNSKYITITPTGTLSSSDPHPDPDPDTNTEESSTLTAILDTLLLSLPLSSLHFTLAFLAAHQYAQQSEISLSSLFQNTCSTALPILTFLIHLAHGHILPLLAPRLFSQSPSPAAAPISPRVRAAARTGLQIVYTLTANVAGCYLIYLTNDRGYYAVMKRAPAIGTLWVWCVLELGLLGALAGVVGPGIFAAWNGYGIF